MVPSVAVGDLVGDHERGQQVPADPELLRQQLPLGGSRVRQVVDGRQVLVVV